MKAALVPEKGKIICIDTPLPSLQDGHVLIRTLSCAICGSDLHEVFMPLRGDIFPYHPGFPGHEGVGAVLDSNGTKFREGQLVLVVPDRDRSNCFSEFEAVHPRYLLPLPDGVPHHTMALAQPLGAVIFGLKRLSMPFTPDTALVLGQGAIGLFFTWLLKRAGVERLITTDKSRRRRELSRQYGANIVLDPSVDDVVNAVRDLTDGKGVPLVIEAAGHDEPRRQAVSCVGLDGYVCFFGLPEQDEMDGFPFAEAFRSRATMRSIYDSQHEPGLSSFAEATNLISSGQIDLNPLVTHRLPIEEVQGAFEIALQNKEESLKVVIEFPGNDNPKMAADAARLTT